MTPEEYREYCEACEVVAHKYRTEANMTGTIYVQSDPSYYGPDTTPSDARRFAAALAASLRHAFPSDTVVVVPDHDRPYWLASDPEAVREWVEAHWLEVVS